MKGNKELQKIENIMEIETPIDTTSKEFEKMCIRDRPRRKYTT